MNEQITVDKFDLTTLRRRLASALDDLDSILKGEALKQTPVFDSLSKQERIQYITHGVTRFYDISKADLAKRTNNPYAVQRRHYVSKILYDYVPLGYDEIAKCLGYSNHTAVLAGVQKMNDYLSDEVYGDSRVKATWNSLVGYLELTKAPVPCV